MSVTTGRPGNRAPLAARAAELRAQGMTGIQVAEAMGISRSYAYGLLSDPDGSLDKQRKATYSGTCEACGGPTNGGDGPNAPKICADCLTWSRDGIVAAVEDFFAEHNRSPRVQDSYTGEAGHGRIPGLRAVQRHWPNWNAMLADLGLPLNMDRRPETQAKIEQMLRDGSSVAEVAEAFGWTPGNIHVRLQTRGMTVTDLNPRYFEMHGHNFRPRRPDHVRRRAVQLYASGMSSHQVAQAIGDGVVFTTVIRWARAAGVPIRPRSGWIYEKAVA